jgi:hypothetical protein
MNLFTCDKSNPNGIATKERKEHKVENDRGDFKRFLTFSLLRSFAAIKMNPLRQLK